MSELRKLRINAGLQRKYVALKLEINPDYLNHLERGIGKMDKCRAEKMAKLYNCSSEKILDIWGKMNGEKTS